MRYAIMAEKPSTANTALEACSRIIPNFFDNDVTLGFMHPYANLNKDFRYPHDLKWSDYPFASANPAYKPFAVTSFIEPVVIKAGTTLHDLQYKRSTSRSRLMPDHGMDLEQTMVARLREADRVYFFMDTHPSSNQVAKRAMEYLFPQGNDKVLIPYIPVFKGPSVDTAIADAVTYSMSHDYGDYIANRQRFDFLYNVNSMGLLRRAIAQCGGNPSYAPSKFELQLLYILRTMKSASDDKLVEVMHDWKGTGKYDPTKGQQSNFGSYASRDNFVENVVEAGLAERHDLRVTLSAAGERLLSSLPPACFDPDLPFRLDAWCSLPADEARVKIERYINMFFYKIKRKLGQAIPVEPLPEDALTLYED